jgi:hypothetical protein
MSIQYEPVIDELGASDDYPDERPEIFFMRTSNRRGQKWPRSIGIVQIIVGILIGFLGTCIHIVQIIVGILIGFLGTCIHIVNKNVKLVSLYFVCQLFFNIKIYVA